MNYQIELYDNANRRIAVFDDVPLLEAIRTAPDRPDTIRGILPAPVADLSPGYRVRVVLDGAPFLDAVVTAVRPQWGDTKKLILDRFVYFHEVIEFEAEVPARYGNTTVIRAYTNRSVDQIVRNAIDTALGNIHYWVDHTAYPDGAEREYAKFLARKTDENELEVGGIASGQWVGAERMDLTNAAAKDGDTIEGIKVDGEDWPDLRLMMIDAEETSRNSHAISRHPEVADWTDAQYDASGYKLKADAATAYLQSLIDTKGIDFIELNPHQNITGAFDDRVDAFGRYLGLVYGGGECFNAALVENSHAEVLLFADGEFHVPDMALKDFYSYAGAHAGSIEAAPTVLSASAGVMEILTLVAYAAGGYVWSMDQERGVHFRAAVQPNRVVYFDPVQHAAALGSRVDGVINGVFVDGNPVVNPFEKTYVRGESIDEYGFRGDGLDLFSITNTADADLILDGMLDDIAYPEPIGEIVFLHGDTSIRVGDIVELRDVRFRRLEVELPDEWGGRFIGKHIARVNEVMHRFQGRRVETTARFTSPLRSVDNPLAFIVRAQPSATSLFQFRLDEATVGLDDIYHLD
jgi:hypothetical protein